MTFRRILSRAAVAAAAALVVAAGAAGTLHAIEGGDATSAEERARVVRFIKKLTTRDGTACTGTRVGALWALTAAHCVHPFVRSFGESGGRTVEADTRPVAVVVDREERRILLAGRDQVGIDSRAAVVWARDEFGARDASFYTGQRVPLLFDDVAESEAHDLALLPDGGVVVVGRAQVGTETQMLVARVSPAGVVVRAPFAGAEALGFEPALPGIARAVVADDVGRVTVGGAWLEGGLPRAVLEAYDADTTLAAGFTWDRQDTPGEIVDLVALAGTDHVVALLVPPRGAAQLLRIDEEGRTVASLELGAVRRLGAASAGAAGFVYAAESGPDGLFVVQRVSTSGGGLVRDVSFGAAGHARAVFPHAVSLASIVVDGAGRVTLGGATHGLELCDFGALARFTAAGALDASFGHGGLQILDDVCRSAATVAALAVLPAADAAAGDAPALVVAQALGSDTSLALLAGDHRFTARLELEVAGARVPIAQVFRHPNPEIDVALVSLAAPVPGDDPGAGPPPAELVFTGGPDSLRDRTIVCTGFGTPGADGVPTPVDVPLTRGGFDLDGVDAHRLSLATPTAQGFIPGDSGGPCWIDEPAGPRLVGVMERTLSGATAGQRRGWSAAAALHQIVRAAPLAPWIAAVAIE